MKKKIMIVDDKSMMANIITMSLPDSYDIVFFDNPLKAMSWLEEGNIPDLAIIDIMMPDMRGDEFLYMLKRNDNFSNIRTVMLSAEDSSTTRMNLLASGADDYIIKPFNPLEFKTRIENLLQ